MPAAPAEVVRQLRWRYAVKQFDPDRTIPADTWAALEASLVLAPSSYGLQPWQFVVITDRAAREKLVGHSYGQRQVADASHLVVFGLKLGMAPADADRHAARIAEVRHQPPGQVEELRRRMAGSLTGKPQPEIDAWMRCQVYIALGQFLAAAAMMAIDTCPMEGFSAPAYDAELGLTARGYTAAVLCPAGYRSADDKYGHLAKVRFPADRVVTYAGG